MIKFDFNTYMPSIDLIDYKEKIEAIKNRLNTDNNMLGWYKINEKISSDLIKDIKKIALNIRNNCDVFIVIGIGGSFLGSSAIINALKPYFDNSKPEIIFAGTSLSSEYLTDLWNYISNKSIVINVISKSGTTLEPNIAFDYLYDKLKEKYSEQELLNRIVITTDNEDGTLRKLANEKHFKSYIIPDDVGGRYSVLTPVGLLPIAVANIDIEAFINGTKEVNIDSALEYAARRNYLYRHNLLVESFTIYEPKLQQFTEWLKQLFAETEGKNNQGILPISAVNTRDLHSLGQFYQQGSRILFETVINFAENKDIKLKQFNMSLNEINNLAIKQVAKAHYKDSTYSNIITLDKLNEYNLGYLIYYFELSAAAGGFLLGIDPFNQPGVNAYKDLINEEIN